MLPQNKVPSSEGEAAAVRKITYFIEISIFFKSYFRKAAANLYTHISSVQSQLAALKTAAAPFNQNCLRFLSCWNKHCCCHSVLGEEKKKVDILQRGNELLKDCIEKC